jgi:excisionase family DNA binding protein
MQRKEIINDLIEHLVEEQMEKMITIKELAEMVPWSWRQIYNLVWKGKFPIPAYKVGQRICFKMSEVMKWMDGLDKIDKVQAA